MKLTNVQLTMVIPYKVDDEMAALDAVKHHKMVKQCVREGRELISFGILREERYETEVVLNYE